MTAHAVHAQDDDLHAVAVGSLRVLIREEAGEWFAQGVEIDYAASADSLEDVKHRFERGLADTIDAHLKRYQTLERLLKIAPEEVWKPLKSKKAFAFSMVTTHDLVEELGEAAERLPFEQIK